jgi:pimeloyl-ACP methyl ester carboxylesterase
VGDGGESAGTGSWTAEGKPVDWLPVRTGELVPQLVRNGWRLTQNQAHLRPTLLRLRPAYESGLTHAHPDARRAAAIAADRIRAPILFAAGRDDAVWPSAEMAGELARARSRPDDLCLVFEDAGHLLRLGTSPTDALWTGGIALGGSRSGQAAAELQLWPAIVGFLAG